MKTQRGKGGDFERFLMNRIRAVMGFTKEQCYRTPMSGGHYALRTASDLTFTADVQERWPWVVEAKHWKQFRAGNFLALTAKEDGCFKQAMDATERANAKPQVPGLMYRTALIVKANFRDSFVAFELDYVTEHAWYTPHVYFETQGRAWMAIEFEQFLAMVKDRRL